MSLFAIGDLHLSLSTEKPMDIFSGWENYVDKLKENWNSIVSDDDTVIIVGDISWGMNLNEAFEDFKFINDQLHGKKIILKGNHDYWFDTKKKVDNFLIENNFKNIQILFNNSFSVEGYAICGTRGWINENGENVDKKILIREAGRLKTSLESGEKFDLPLLAFLHYPPVFATTECKEILDVLLEFNIKNCYYGHIHGQAHNYAIDGIYKGIDFHLVSCDYVNFSPVKIQ